MFRIWVIAVCLAVLGGGAIAADTRSPPTLLELTSTARLHDVMVSPNGQYLAYVRRVGAKDIVTVLDIAARKQTVIFNGENFDSTDVEWVRWKGDNRLVFAYLGIKYVRDEAGALKKPPANWTGLDVIPSGYTHAIVAINRDGSAPLDTEWGRLLNAMEPDPGHLLIEGMDRDSVGRWIKAIRIDVQTGERTVLDRGAGLTFGWAADNTGRLILRYEVLGQNGGLRVLARAGETDWRELFIVRPKDIRAMPDLQIVGQSNDPAKVYVAVQPDGTTEGDTRELHLYDFVSRTMGPRIWSHPTYDFDEVVYAGNGRDIAGLCFWADVYRCDFMDAVVKQDYLALEGYFGRDKSLVLGSASSDGAVRVVSASGADDPGGIYIFDRDSGKIQLLGAQMPTLRPERLGKATVVRWTASDGAAMSGYLTVPPGVPAEKLPLVVLPHGGPEARDHLNFDRWAQAFATRGYAVFQPSFRGSGGFGSKFARLGYGQWGLRMQDDIMEGVQSLIASGRVDAGRICIVGASYGGYASLYAGAKHPERFKCVVSFAGVSDLVAMQKWERGTRGADSPVYRYWLKSIGDPDKDRDRLTATSPITYAGAYSLPLLLIHGERDGIVPIAQSRAMETAMRKAGRPVRLIEVEGEGHSGWDPDNEAMALQEMIDFVKKAIGDPS
jgi:dipeptidyl aminopeptidase/acylaminoacyl peptidase